MSTEPEQPAQAVTVLYVRGFPVDLIEEIDRCAAEIAGSKALPSRTKTLAEIVRRGIADLKRKR